MRALFMKLYLQINNPAKHKGSFGFQIINAWNQGLLTKSEYCTTLVVTFRVSLLKASDHHLHHILQQLWWHWSCSVCYSCMWENLTFHFNAAGKIQKCCWYHQISNPANHQHLTIFTAVLSWVQNVHICVARYLILLVFWRLMKVSWMEGQHDVAHPESWWWSKEGMMSCGHQWECCWSDSVEASITPISFPRTLSHWQKVHAFFKKWRQSPHSNTQYLWDFRENSIISSKLAQK